MYETVIANASYKDCLAIGDVLSAFAGAFDEASSTMPRAVLPPSDTPLIRASSSGSSSAALDSDAPRHRARRRPGHPDDYEVRLRDVACECAPCCTVGSGRIGCEGMGRKRG